MLSVKVVLDVYEYLFIHLNWKGISLSWLTKNLYFFALWNRTNQLINFFSETKLKMYINSAENSWFVYKMVKELRYVHYMYNTLSPCS